MVDYVYMRAFNVDLIQDERLNKVETNDDRYGIYHKYLMGNLVMKYYEKSGYLSIWGSIREYYFKKKLEHPDYWKYNLSIDNIYEIGNDLSSIGINIDKLHLVSYEYGPTLKISNIVQNIEIFKNGLSNTYGISSFKGISKYKINKGGNIRKSPLLRIYSPELLIRSKAIDDELEYTRLEIYVPKGIKKLHGLDDRAVFSLLLDKGFHIKMKNHLLGQLKRVLFISKVKQDEMDIIKKNELFNKSMSLKRNRMLAEELAKKYNNSQLANALYRFRKEREDKSIYNIIEVEIDIVFNNTVIRVDYV